jgi:hypothetical protein
VPFPPGYPLGRPSDPPAQHSVLHQLLRLVLADAVPLVAELSTHGDPVGPAGFVILDEPAGRSV